MLEFIELIEWTEDRTDSDDSTEDTDPKRRSGIVISDGGGAALSSCNVVRAGVGDTTVRGGTEVFSRSKLSRCSLNWYWWNVCAGADKSSFSVHRKKAKTPFIALVLISDGL